MTCLNNEIAIRRQLVEKIESLEKKVAEKGETITRYENTISEYSQKCYYQDMKFKDLVDVMGNIAMQIPQQYRRQIMNALPNL